MLIDIIVELLFEILVEGFISLCDVFVPGKLKSEKLKLTITLVFLLLACLLFIGLIFAIIALIENRGKSLFGWVMVGVNVIYVTCGVLIKLFQNRK